VILRAKNAVSGRDTTPVFSFGTKRPQVQILSSRFPSPHFDADRKIGNPKGNPDGTAYKGECACLVGTIANARRCEVGSLPNLIKPNSARPAERWFLHIKKGDKPANNQLAKLAWNGSRSSMRWSARAWLMSSVKGARREH
jgi:hypothetical protein